jgi:hypothetical protein
MMLQIRIAGVVRAVIAFCLAVGLALTPPLNVLAHSSVALQTEQDRHAALAAGETAADHGHSHDDDDPQDHKRLGHVHGHDASDHTHDTGTPSRLRSSERMFLPRAFGLTPEPLTDPAPIFRLDRPPRLSL